MKKIYKFSRACLVLLLLALMLLPIFGTAAADEVGTLTVQMPANGCTYRIYLVGRIEGNKILLNSRFKGVTGSDLGSIAAQLAVRVADEKPLGEQIIHEGYCKFKNLARGVYLVTGETFEYDGTEYRPIPSLVSMPAKSGGVITWDTKMVNKYNKVGSQDLNVMKVWSGDSESVRPTSVTVQLKCNGELYGEPVELSKANNWRHTWRGLSTTDNWSVTELKVPANYTATVSRNGTTFVITNTRKTPTPTTPPKIPQTGQLWWPVYSMVYLGLAFILIGIIRRRKSEENA